MYNYNFKENDETLLKEKENIAIKIKDNHYQTNFVLTEKNLLAFYDINKGEPIWGMGTVPLKELYLLFKIPLDDLKYTREEDMLYIVNDNEKITCYNFDLENFLNNKN